MLVGQYQLPSTVSEDLTREDRWSGEFPCKCRALCADFFTISACIVDSAVSLEGNLILTFGDPASSANSGAGLGTCFPFLSRSLVVVRPFWSLRDQKYRMYVDKVLPDKVGMHFLPPRLELELLSGSPTATGTLRTLLGTSPTAAAPHVALHIIPYMSKQGLWSRNLWEGSGHRNRTFCIISIFIQHCNY